MIKAAFLGVLLAASLCAQTRVIDALLERAGVPKAPAPAPAETTAVSSAPGVRQLHLAWSPGAGATGPRAASTGRAMSVLSDRRLPGGLRRQRQPELGRNKLLAVAVDTQGRALHWEIVPDPRILRAEAPKPSGELSGVVLQRPAADILFAFPDGLAPASVRLYQTNWERPEPALELVADLPLDGAR